MPRLFTWQVWTCVWREERPASGSALEALVGREEVLLFPAAPWGCCFFYLILEWLPVQLLLQPPCTQRISGQEI